MKPLERSVQASIARRLRALHASDPTFMWRKRHGTSFGVAGDPDLYGVWRGVSFAIELKAPGEEPTELQKARLAEWSAAGAWTGVVRSVAELEACLAAIREKPSKGA